MWDYIENKIATVLGISAFGTAASETSTASYGTNNTQIATTAYVHDAIKSGGFEFITGTHGSTATSSWTGVTRDATLYTGKCIAYKLSSAGVSGTQSTLNLTLADGTTTGAKNIMMNNNTAVTNHYAVNSILLLVYDGTAWKLADYNTNTTYSIGDIYSDTAAATAAKKSSYSVYYHLPAADGCVYSTMTLRYANTSQTALSLNVNSTGALPIYINDEVTSATNYTLPAGRYFIKTDGQAYYFRTDKYLPADISGYAREVQWIDTSTQDGAALETDIVTYQEDIDWVGDIIQVNGNYYLFEEIPPIELK